MTSITPGIGGSFDSLDEWQKEFVAEAAEWLIQRIAQQAVRIKTPLEEWEIGLLRTDLRQVMNVGEQYAAEGHGPAEVERYEESVRLGVQAIMSKSVKLVRDAITADKRQGTKNIKLVRGLSIPEDWMQNYMAVYNTEAPWIISGVMQDSFLGHAAFGERKPWRSF